MGLRDKMLETMLGAFGFTLAIFDELNTFYVSRTRKQHAARQEASIEHAVAPEVHAPTNCPGSWLLNQVTDMQQALAYHPFINKFVSGETVDEDVYINWLNCQLAIFRGIELCVRTHAVGTPLDAVREPKLDRLVSVEHDLSFWGGSGWKGLEVTMVVASSTKVSAYLEQLQGDVDDPWMLLCHHIVVYTVALLSSLSIGSMVRTHVCNRLREDVEDELAANSNVGAEVFALQVSLKEYIGRVNRLDIPEDLRGRMLEHMRVVLGLLSAIFDEHCSLHLQGTSPPIVDASVSEPRPALPTNKQELKTFTLDELRATDDPRLLVSILGRVYDLSADRRLFGKGGPYEMFVGHDGTYNLAVMSLKQKTLDKFEYTLDEDDKQTLADWIAYFDKNHGPPIGQLNDPVRSHVLTMKDLPAVKKIPFSSEEDTPEPARASRL